MAKRLGLINKDIVQYYKFNNLIAPPEAEELTKIYDELQTILEKQPSETLNKHPNLDYYYRILFKFIKLLHVLKFGADQDTSTPIPLKYETKETMTDKQKKT